MNNFKRLITCFVFALQLIPVKGTVAIMECDNGRLILREGQNPPSPVTCEGFSAGNHVTWNVTGGPWEASITCAPQCSESPDLDLAATRTGDTESVLRIVGNLRNWENASVSCEVEGETASCDIDVIAQAQLTGCRVYHSKDKYSFPTWNVSATCSYSGAYSSSNNYTCTWRQRNAHGSQVLPDVTFTGSITEAGVTVVQSGNVYHSGTCSYTSPQPTRGNYSYFIDFFPGPGTTKVGDILIQPPGPPILEATSCPDYLFEYRPLRCNCLQNPEVPGNPLPVLHWVDTPATKTRSVQLNMHHLDRSYGRRNFTCSLSWGPQADRVEGEVQYELKIAYGPDAVNVTGSNPVHEADTEMTLTCTAHDVYPSAGMTWSGVTCSSAGQSNDTRCRFVPGLEDDGKLVTCTAWNPVHPERTRKNGTYTLSLIHPPASPPVMTGYAPNSSLSAGDNVTLTCHVTGGKPRVTSVSVSCGSKVRVEPSTGQSAIDVEANQTTVWASFTVLSVEAIDQGTVCVCTGHWSPREDAYTSSASVVLSVIDALGASVTHEETRAEHKGNILPVELIAGGVAALTVLILIIVVVVVVVSTNKFSSLSWRLRHRRRCRRIKVAVTTG